MQTCHEKELLEALRDPSRPPGWVTDLRILHLVINWQLTPGDLSGFALADRIEESGSPELAHLAWMFRWTERTGHRPFYRDGKRLRKRWAWYQAYGAKASEAYRSDLPVALYASLPHVKTMHGFLCGEALYPTFWDTIDDLGHALASLRGLLDQPRRHDA